MEFKNNSPAAIVMSEESKKKFMESWKETKVDIEDDNARRSKILEAVKPLVGTADPKTVVVDIPEVKKIIGDAKVCWGCTSTTCLLRQNLSLRLTKKRLVNKLCMTRRLLIGDKVLVTSLETKVEKDKQTAAYEKKKDKGVKKKKDKVNNFSAAVKKKPSAKEENPAEPIEQVNLTGIPNEQLFGPAFLYTKQENFVEKKTTSE